MAPQVFLVDNVVTGWRQEVSEGNREHRGAHHLDRHRPWRVRPPRHLAQPGRAPGAGRPEQHFPVAVVYLHGLLAIITLVLVLLTALGVGSS